MIGYRHCDPRYPFLWEDGTQPAARWHGDGGGPVHYLADTPTGAWAEFLRHEEITDVEDLLTIRRAIWAVEFDAADCDRVDLPDSVLTGGKSSYPRCRAEAARMEAAGSHGLRARSAALLRGGANGQIVDAGLRDAGPRDGVVHALFGRRPHLEGWRVAHDARPHSEVLDRVRHF